MTKLEKIYYTTKGRQSKIIKLKYMDIKNIFKSRTVLVIILLFIINGIEGIREFIPVGLLPLIDGVLGILAIYFRVKPKQDFSQ